MEQLLLRYGYALVFAGVLVEGEAVLLLAGLLARRGFLALPLVVLTAVAANTCADVFYFTVARRSGRAWLDRRYAEGTRVRRMLGAVDRRGPLILLLSRFAWGLRIAIPAACGASRMTLARFLATDVAAGVLWAVPVAWLGFGVGAALPSLLDEVHGFQIAFAVALVLAVIGLHYARRNRAEADDARRARGDLEPLVPLLIGATGVVNLVTSVWPLTCGSLLSLATWLPVEVVQRSRPLMLFSGLALLQVARNLSRRKALAWWVAVLALGVSFASHLGHGSGAHHALMSGALLGWLVVHRRRYTARSDPRSARRALLVTPALALLVLVYGWVGLHRLHAQYDWPAGRSPLAESAWSGLLIAEPTVEPQAPAAARFLGSVEVAGWLARLYLLVLLLRPVMVRRRLEAPAEAVEQAFKAWARRSLQSFAAQGDKHHLLVAGGRGLVAYAVRGGVALAAGDPLAPADQFEHSVRAYVQHCRGNGWVPCIYEAAEEALPVYRSLGLRQLKMAEEAVIDLPSFSLAGGKRAALRALVNKATRLGLVVEPYDRQGAADPAVDAQLTEISRQWLAGKPVAEMGFSLSRFSLDALAGVRVFLCRREGRVEAFCTWRPYRGGHAVVLDLMRRRADAVSGTMDLLLATALLRLRDLGLDEASLANAPFASVDRPRTLRGRLSALALRRTVAACGYRGLFQFKKKFDPRWEGRYLVYPTLLDLPRVVYAMATVHGGAGLRDLVFGR